MQFRQKILASVLLLISIVTVTGVADNKDGTVVIQNTIPDTWNGRKFNVGIYKNDKLFIVTTDLHVGDKVSITIKPLLYFAVVRNFELGEIFTSFEYMTHIELFDLTKFPNGMEVTLTQEPGGGRYKFTADNAVLGQNVSILSDL